MDEDRQRVTATRDCDSRTAWKILWSVLLTSAHAGATVATAMLHLPAVAAICAAATVFLFCCTITLIIKDEIDRRSR